MFASGRLDGEPRSDVEPGIALGSLVPFIDELDKFAQVWPGKQSQKFPTAPAGILFPGDPGDRPSC